MSDHIKELAEARTDARPQPSAEDEKYSGVARHPLSRRWLRRSLQAEKRKAVAAGPGAERQRHLRVASGLQAQLTPEVKK